MAPPRLPLRQHEDGWVSGGEPRDVLRFAGDSVELRSDGEVFSGKRVPEAEFCALE